ncbi:MAG TPA: cellulase family glycosylhydrolase [Kineosporiaceae bacterium]|nr:cellulase family glycosylhydrolase [Kineosporiaceae bacterium]
MTRLLVGSLLALAVALPSALSPSPASAASGLWFDGDAAARVSVAPGAPGGGPVLRDQYGREVVLRGFNVSGEAKLAENGGLPFANLDDARASAAAMRGLTGSNTVRFLAGWSSAEPTPGAIDRGYLDRLAAQLQVFLDGDFRVILDWHQDLYSQSLFNAGSWYTGDGAPAWVIAAGGYPRESCGICFQWGQNMTQNTAVQSAIYDFWHNRALTTSAGTLRVQDEFVRMSGQSLTYLKSRLTASQYAGILGVDPFNEPFPGRFDPGQDGAAWERDLLVPFYQRFRASMDTAGWADKPALVEPDPFWNINIPFEAQTGGFSALSTLGPRFVFNTHFYDAAELSGLFMWGSAASGRYSTDFATVRTRAAGLGSAAIVTEFGSPMSGSVAGKTPSVFKALYQSLDSTQPGSSWWKSPAASGAALSGTMWQWDVYSGRHHELMNGNPGKVLTAADAWNGEDFSVVARDAAGNATLRQDPRVLDRVYPQAVAGTLRAFTYEDRARDGGTTLVWNSVPATMPNLAAVAGSGRFAVLAWTSTGIAAPTEFHLPADFPAATTVVSDLGSVTGPGAYAGPGGPAVTVSGQPGPGGGRRLLITSLDSARHVALVTDGTPVSAAVLAAAQRELTSWAATTLP